MRKTALFDLDGTLLHTLPDITASTNHVLALYGRPPCTEAAMREYVGNGAANQLRCSWGGPISDALLAEVLARYQAYYSEHLDATHPYAGITAMLRALRARGFRTAVVTNKPALPTERLCVRLLGELLDAVVGEAPALPRKPAPDMAEEAMRRLGAAREDCVFVGDSDVDVATAGNCGIPCLSCTWGYRTEEELSASGAGRLVRTPEELLAALTEEPPQ